MAFILGRKIGMTRIFREDGRVVPVTVIEAGPVTVTQIRTREKEGYDAVQFGFGSAKKKKSSGISKVMRELRMRDNTPDKKEYAVGQSVDVSALKSGDMVKVSGITKGKGFQGAVKRHGFHGMPASHGHHHVMRHVGSIGQRFPQHTLPGMRMAGRMGGARQTVRGLEVISVDPKKNLLIVKGAVPGRKGTPLEIASL